MTPQEHFDAEREERAELDNLVKVLGTSERVQFLGDVGQVDTIVQTVERQYGRETW